MEEATDNKYEIHTIDLTSVDVQSFNPIEHIKNLEFETKYYLLEMLYNLAVPSFVPPLPMTVSNFKIQEYRVSHISYMFEFYTDICVPALFPLTREEYEKVASLALNDNNMYKCPLFKN